jgi:hypothetical protein
MEIIIDARMMGCKYEEWTCCCNIPETRMMGCEYEECIMLL